MIYNITAKRDFGDYGISKWNVASCKRTLYLKKIYIVYPQNTKKSALFSHIYQTNQLLKLLKQLLQHCNVTSYLLLDKAFTGQALLLTVFYFKE